MKVEKWLLVVLAIGVGVLLFEWRKKERVERIGKKGPHGHVRVYPV